MTTQRNSKLLRIAFFSHYFPPEGNAPASRTYEHCKRWVKQGTNVTVITCAPNVPDGVIYEGFRNRLWPQRETVDGIEVIRIWTYVAANSGGMKRILNYVSYLVSAVFAFLLFCRRPHVIVATSPQFFCGWAGTICSWLKWCPFVLEIRDIWPESIITVGAMKEGALTRVLEVMEKWLYRSANHIVTVGKGYRDNVLSKVSMSNRISVVTNGVDPEVFSPRVGSDEFRQQHGLEGKFLCSYVGTIGMAHGLSIVVRAAKRLKDMGREEIMFCLVGDGASREAIQQQAIKEGVESFVRFAGRLPKADMPIVLASSDCLLVHLKKTDLFETVIPSKIFETMAMERPLIMGVQGESADIVADSGSGIQIESDNEVELVDAILKLSDDTALYQQLCQSGRKFVKQHYTRDALAANMLKTIQAVAARKPVAADA